VIGGTSGCDGAHIEYLFYYQNVTEVNRVWPANRSEGRRTLRNMDQGESAEEISASWACDDSHLTVESTDTYMQGILKNPGQLSRVVSVFCVVMLLVMGTVQAVHFHAENRNAPRHTCSICSTPNAKLNTAQTSPVPLMMALRMAIIETAAPRIFRAATPNFVRPPPAA
jgi:hypothetical protein